MKIPLSSNGSPFFGPGGSFRAVLPMRSGKHQARLTFFFGSAPRARGNVNCVRLFGLCGDPGGAPRSGFESRAGPGGSYARQSVACARLSASFLVSLEHQPCVFVPRVRWPGVTPCSGSNAGRRI